MNGIEIERMLRMIDANIDSTQRMQNDEMLRYIREHESEVESQLRSGNGVSIPTSMGVVKIPMSALSPA